MLGTQKNVTFSLNSSAYFLPSRFLSLDHHAIYDSQRMTGKRDTGNSTGGKIAGGWSEPTSESADRSQVFPDCVTLGSKEVSLSSP